MLWGAGRNGKSRLMAAVAALMGPNTVCNQRIGSLESSRFSLGQLAGKLMLLDDDVSIGTRLPDGLLKQISERKPMTAEHKFGNTFQFTCLALPVMLCNNLPNVGDLSLGIRRRANVIPFSRVFTESEVDPTLFNRVLETELPGVLNRALEGLQRLRGRGGFAVPADCAKAARDWLVMANPLPAFIDERCIANPSGSCRTAEFYRRYQDWARENGIRSIIGGNHIKSALRDLGYELREVRGYPEVKGLLLKP